MTTSPLSPNHPICLLATWFGVGEYKKAPGTLASLAALPFAYGIQTFFGGQGLLIATFIAFLGGAWICDQYMQRNNIPHDAPEIVIDEIAGQWLILLAFPATLQGYLLAFILFRFFDILKPWPINLIDAKAKGGTGVMLDDFAAGLIPGMLFALLTLALMVSGHNDWVVAVYDLLGGNGIF